ncbi:hypothetical protein D3C83_48970 [compost metagenome]
MREGGFASAGCAPQDARALARRPAGGQAQHLDICGNRPALPDALRPWNLVGGEQLTHPLLGELAGAGELRRGKKRGHGAILNH